MEYRDGSRLLYVWMFLGYYTTLHYTYDFQAIHSISNSSLSSSPTNVTFCSVWKKYYDIHVSVGVGMYSTVQYSTVQYSTALDLTWLAGTALIAYSTYGAWDISRSQCWGSMECCCSCSCRVCEIGVESATPPHTVKNSAASLNAVQLHVL
jgi:hypothetical protein